MANGLDANIILEGSKQTRDAFGQGAETVQNIEQNNQTLQSNAMKLQQQSQEMSDSQKLTQAYHTATDANDPNSVLEAYRASGASGAAQLNLQKNLLGVQLDKSNLEKQGIDTKLQYIKLDEAQKASYKAQMTEALETLGDIDKMDRGTATSDAVIKQYLQSNLDQEVKDKKLSPEQAQKIMGMAFTKDGKFNRQAFDGLYSQTQAKVAAIAQQDQEDKHAKSVAETEKERAAGVLDRAKAEQAKSQATGASLSPEGQKLKDELSAMDASFMGRMGKDGIAQMNRTINNWAADGKTATQIIGERQATKGTQQELSVLEKQKGNLVKTEKSIVQAGGFIDQTESAVKAVDLPTVKKLGALETWGKDELSDPALSRYHRQVTQLQTEYAIVLSKGGLITNEARQEAKHIVPDYITPEMFPGLRDDIRKGIGTETKAIDDSISEATHGQSDGNKSPKEPPKTNAKGWMLKYDKSGNAAYVSPDGKQFEEVGK